MSPQYAADTFKNELFDEVGQTLEIVPRVYRFMK
jgi:hypothetical protein